MQKWRQNRRKVKNGKQDALCKTCPCVAPSFLVTTNRQSKRAEYFRFGGILHYSNGVDYTDVFLVLPSGEEMPPVINDTYDNLALWNSPETDTGFSSTARVNVNNFTYYILYALRYVISVNCINILNETPHDVNVLITVKRITRFKKIYIQRTSEPIPENILTETEPVIIATLETTMGPQQTKNIPIDLMEAPAMPLDAFTEEYFIKLELANIYTVEIEVL